MCLYQRATGSEIRQLQVQNWPAPAPPLHCHLDRLRVLSWSVDGCQFSGEQTQVGTLLWSLLVFPRRYYLLCSSDGLLLLHGSAVRWKDDLHLSMRPLQLVNNTLAGGHICWRCTWAGGFVPLDAARPRLLLALGEHQLRVAPRTHTEPHGLDLLTRV